MSDIVSKEKRSEIMSKIKGKNTKPEMMVRKHLHSHGFRFRIHDKRYPGRPDLLLKKHNAAIFVNGCFWHGHEGCSNTRIPKTNTSFWENKLAKNKERDNRKTAELQQSGFRVITLWECELMHDFQNTMNLLIIWLKDAKK